MKFWANLILDPLTLSMSDEGSGQLNLNLLLLLLFRLVLSLEMSGISQSFFFLEALFAYMKTLPSTPSFSNATEIPQFIPLEKHTEICPGTLSSGLKWSSALTSCGRDNAKELCVLDLNCSTVGSDVCDTWVALVVRLFIVLWLEAVSFAAILRLVPHHSGQG